VGLKKLEEVFLILVFKKLFLLVMLSLYNSVSEQDIHRKLVIIVPCWLFKLPF